MQIENQVDQVELTDAEIDAVAGGDGHTGANTGVEA